MTWDLDAYTAGVTRARDDYRNHPPRAYCEWFDITGETGPCFNEAKKRGLCNGHHTALIRRHRAQ